MLRKKCLILLFLILYAFNGKGQVTFVIESLPTATPKRDTIFITGTFNNWKVDDARFMFKKQPDGSLSLVANLDKGTEYKITRGSWMKVETDADNTYTANRVFNGNEEVIHVRIDNWLDSGGAETLHFIIFYFFAIAFHSLVLLFLAQRATKQYSLKYKTFFAFNIVLTLLFVGIVLYNLSDLIVQTLLSHVFRVMFLAWGPFVYVFAKTFNEGKWERRMLRHFLPIAAVSVLSTLYLLRSEPFEFLAFYLRPFLSLEGTLTICAGIIFNLYYMLKSVAVADFIRVMQGHVFVKYFARLNLTVLMSFAVNLLLLHFGVNTKFIIDFEVVFLLFSVIIIYETWFILKQPEILRERLQHFDAENFGELKEKINRYMREKKPFENPELTLDMLANEIGVKPHVLSKVLNECINKNFRDFVNSYRIKEFIRLADDGRLEHYTFLALAHEVGFNSKSTFNLAFKKITGQNPREYFKTHHSQYTP